MPEITITNTRDVAASRLSMLVVGESGVGKTTLAKTIPDGQRAIIISAESGLLSLSGTEIDVIQCPDWLTFVEAYKWVKKNGADYQWVFIDSLSELAQRLVERMKERYPNRSDSMVMWGEYSDTMTNAIKAWRDLSTHNVVFTALPSVDKDGVTGARFVGIDIAGKISAKLPAFFDEVFSLRIFRNESGEERRCLVTYPHDGWVGKDRSGALDAFEPPHLGQVAAKILKPITQPKAK